MSSPVLRRLVHGPHWAGGMGQGQASGRFSSRCGPLWGPLLGAYPSWKAKRPSGKDLDFGAGTPGFGLVLPHNRVGLEKPLDLSELPCPVCLSNGTTVLLSVPAGPGRRGQHPLVPAASSVLITF